MITSDIRMLSIFVGILFLATLAVAELNGTLGFAPAAFGIDTTSSINSDQALCFARAGYKAGFFRIHNRGQNDPTGIRNVLNFYNAQLSFEVFVTPNPSGYGDRQFEQAYEFARQNDLTLNRVWLQVTSPIQWDRVQSSNVRFINEFVRAGRSRNVRIGYYTNWYDYEEITGNSRVLTNDDLWYWHVLGGGANGETARDFNDYRTFGPFVGYPKVKQYGVGENPCSVIANQDVFAGGSLNLKDGSMAIGMGATLKVEKNNKTKQ